MDSSIFLQQMVNGFSLGSMYALIAIGYTMVYGVLRLINFAHGDIMMVGAYVGLFAMTSLHLPFVFAIVFSVTIAIILGISIDRVAYKPLRKAPRISLLITAIGVSFLLENLFNVIFGGTPRPFLVPEFLEKVINFGEISITLTTIIVPILTLVLLLFVLFILYKTKYGMAIRALAFDIGAVHLMGIDANLIIAIVFALGSSLAAIAGIFWAVSYPSVEPLMGVLIGLKAFAAAVLGGIGSVGGAVIGGFIIGFTEIVVVAFFPDMAGFKDAFAFVFLIFVLLFKPTGILGINYERSRF
ncbi:branched-chain amino acid ABC transporter permease [Campylobacter gastrosuis]|uniref:Branched-chain amino acid ABC transporter permease n=1 Tax=Campylobacter gastrosuis TaxID=2974576 RepID=A0ABT7HN32_9BACT|nr:branched-chain amino acid ABC transporter permease [Campylobacter gastrosuis]MDL0087859.1 branched-chain amino acid ABC transporter permease [Campylobacter gastrosuis]MDL0088070.1 branched-chain amino acid ABC transporter permease [Campylobacter gastrosuis]